MSESVVVKMSKKGNDSIEELLVSLKNELYRSHFVEFIYKVNRNLNDSEIGLLCFEKFFHRTSSYTCVSIMFTKLNEQITADIVVSGGGYSIMNLELGVKKELANLVKSALEKRNFTISE